MYSFKNDYSEGACNQVMEALLKTNMEQTVGYGLDEYCEKASNTIKNVIGNHDVDIHFLVGGTQVNLTAIAAFLRPFEAVIAVATGHICVHETGAIEATGHKVIALSGYDGKLDPREVMNTIQKHNDEHMVKPRLVYVSNPTEVGTIYSKEELISLKNVCKENNLIFYMDGARLPSAMTSVKNDLVMEDLPKIFDAFYIGGTKCGVLFGEALVISNERLKDSFRFMIKQRGGMLAKGRLLGIQFDTLFSDNLYFKLGEHSNKMAGILKDALKLNGCEFITDSYTNQIFPILSKEKIKELEKKYVFELWDNIDNDHDAIRLVTSWATDEEKVLEFIEDLKK